jgi:hypothetical protein
VTFENSPSKVPATDQPPRHFISTEAVASAESAALRRTIHDKARAGQHLEGRRDRAVRIVIMGPGNTAAQRQQAVIDGPRLVSAEA